MGAYSQAVRAGNTVYGEQAFTYEVVSNVCVSGGGQNAPFMNVKQTSLYCACEPPQGCHIFAIYLTLPTRDVLVAVSGQLGLIPGVSDFCCRWKRMQLVVDLLPRLYLSIWASPLLCQ